MNVSSVSVLVAGTETSISDGTLCWYEAEDGVGMPDVERFTEHGPLQRGESDLGFRLLPRSIQLVLRVSGDEVAQEAKRARLLRLFKPRRAPIQLRFYLASGAVRQIDVTYAGNLSFPSKDRNGDSLKVGLTLRAADPAFYDPTPVSFPFALGAGGDQFEIPLEVPIPIGSSTIDQTRVLPYDGDLESYPIIRILGPVASPIIRAQAIDDDGQASSWTLDFTGTTPAAGAYLDIDPRYGSKTIKDQTGALRIAALVEATSDLAACRIVAGSTSVRVTGSGANEQTEVLFVYYACYHGF